MKQGPLLLLPLLLAFAVSSASAEAECNPGQKKVKTEAGVTCVGDTKRSGPLAPTDNDKREVSGEEVTGQIVIPAVTVDPAGQEKIPLSQEKGKGAESRTNADPLRTKTAPAAQVVARPKGENRPPSLESYKRADAGYTQILSRDSNDIPALSGHVEALGAMGRWSEAGSEARRLLSLDPGNEIAQRTITQSAKIAKAAGVAKKFEALAHGLMSGPAEDDARAKAGLALGEPSAAAGRGSPPGRKPAGGPASAMGSGTVPSGTAGAGEASSAAPEASLEGAGSGPAPAGAAVQAGTSGAAPRPFAPLVQRALQKLAIGDATGALFDVTQAADADPGDAGAWTVRAEVESSLRDFSAAVQAADRAIALTPMNARAFRARAFAELGASRYREALVDAVRSIELDPRNGLGYLYKALAEDGLGRLAEAARDVRQAVSLDGSLEPMARPLMAKAGLIAPAGDPRVKARLLRGGLIALSLALVLLGLYGARNEKRLREVLTPRSPSKAAASAEELAPGLVLAGNYRIERELGRGGMGVVYEAFDEALQRRVAIKRLIQDESTTREDLARFLREARLVAQLKHPNLAQIYNVLDGGELLLVFEFVDGRTLDRVLSAERVLAPALARRVIDDAAAALACAHGRGIIHRDLKPSNIMIAGDGSAKVMDFGIAHQARAATLLTRTTASGTPPYMAPEQGLGSVSKASDLYALGVMAYELLCGSRPFNGPDFQEQKLRKLYEPVTRRNPALPRSLDAFFARAFEPDPTKRFVDAAAFAEAFRGACDATPRSQPAAV